MKDLVNKEKSREYSKLWRDKNKEYIKLKKKEYYEKNKEIISEKTKEYRLNNKEKIREIEKRKYNKNISKIKIRAKRYYLNNKQRTLEFQKEYYEQNRKRILERCKIYRKNNREIINAYYKKRRGQDIPFAIKEKIRHRLISTLNDYCKYGKTKACKLYGVNFKEIIENLKPFPEDMENYHIDHIIPLSLFDFNNPTEIKWAFAPENHQWLTKEENLKKGDRFIYIKNT